MIMPWVLPIRGIYFLINKIGNEMKNRLLNIKGQEAIEFILITALVFFGAFFSVMIFGDKLAVFFGNNSQVNKVVSNTPAVVSSSNSPRYEADFETKVEEEVINKAVGNYDLQFNEQGDVMFEAAGQDVMLTADVVESLNTVFETSGANGLGEILEDISYIIEKHKADYPDADVPFDIVFGSGKRQSDTGQTVYEGEATVNTIAIRAGNDLVVFQKDQKCSTSLYTNGCSFQGQYRIEGSIDENNQFSGTVTSNLDAIGDGIYQANFTGSTFTNGKYNFYSPEHHDNFYTNWDFNFNMPKLDI